MALCTFCEVEVDDGSKCCPQCGRPVIFRSALLARLSSVETGSINGESENNGMMSLASISGDMNADELAIASAVDRSQLPGRLKTALKVGLAIAISITAIYFLFSAQESPRANSGGTYPRINYILFAIAASDRKEFSTLEKLPTQVQVEISTVDSAWAFSLIRDFIGSGMKMYLAEESKKGTVYTFGSFTTKKSCPTEMPKTICDGGFSVEKVIIGSSTPTTSG